MDLRETEKQWRRLQGQWALVHVEALAARRQCTAKYASGVGPTMEELQRADELEAKAAELRDQIDELIGTMFGD